jgi:hypothetical protein
MEKTQKLNKILANKKEFYVNKKGTILNISYVTYTIQELENDLAESLGECNCNAELRYGPCKSCIEFNNKFNILQKLKNVYNLH